MNKKVFLSILTVFFVFGVWQPVKATVDFTIPTVENFRVVTQYNKKIKFRWKKVKSTKNYTVNFYQIKTIKKKSGKYRKVKQNKTKKNIAKKTIKKLSIGKVYYFKIRACRTKQQCGPWSERLQTSTTAPDPVLKNLIIDIEPYNASTGMAGGFNFANAYNETKVLYEFGAETTDGAGGTKLLPTFEYRTDPDANIYSPVKGEINLTYQESTTDYEMSISEYNNSDVIVYIDHVKNLQVSDGDSVKAGDLLGTSGTWTSTVGRTELMVTSSDGYECPFNYFDPDLKTEYENKVTQLMQDWESFKYDDTIYDEASMTFAAGCPYDSLTNDEL